MDWVTNWYVRRRPNESEVGLAGGRPEVKQLHGDSRAATLANCWEPRGLTNTLRALFLQYPEWYAYDRVTGTRVASPKATKRAYRVTSPAFVTWVAEV